MAVQLDNIEYNSAAEALRANAPALVAGSKIKVEDNLEAMNGLSSYELENGKFMCINYSFASIQGFFKEIGMNLSRDLEMVNDNIVIESNDSSKVSRPIPARNKEVIKNEAESSEFVGKSYDGQLRRYNMHHIVPYMNAKEIEGYIHNPNNLIALDHNNHDIMHHGRMNEVIILLSKIFEAYPEKLRFIEAENLSISDIAEMSLNTHKGGD